MVITNLPIRKVLQKPDMAGRMVHWAVELFEFNIQYEPRGSIKGQVYTNFMVELRSKDSQLNSNDFQWVLLVDGPPISKGALMIKSELVLVNNQIKFTLLTSWVDHLFITLSYWALNPVGLLLFAPNLL